MSDSDIDAKIERAEFEAVCAADPIAALEFCLTLDPENPVHRELAHEIIAAVQTGEDFMDELLRVSKAAVQDE